jgi:ribosomal protein L37AE/L43A
MSFETKEQILENILSKEKPACPHCKKEMTLWEVPPFSFGDGLGWGVPYLFVCFNDECHMYKQGWDSISDNYGHVASYRCMCYPGTTSFEYMPVFSKFGGSDQIIDNNVLLEQEMLKENIKKGFSILADCYVTKDPVSVLSLLLDATQPVKVRAKAAEMIGDIGDLEVIDPIKNLKFSNEILQKNIDDAVQKIHEKFFTKECPFCTEIIKKRANICKHCGKEVAGQ